MMGPVGTGQAEVSEIQDRGERAAVDSNEGSAWRGVAFSGHLGISRAPGQLRARQPPPPIGPGVIQGVCTSGS